MLVVAAVVLVAQPAAANTQVAVTTPTMTAIQPTATSSLLVAQHSGKCLGVANASTADVADIIQISCDSRKQEQQWAFTHVGSSQYLAVARHSSKCLDVFNNGTDDLAEIIQFRCVPLSQAQQWRFV